MAVVLLPEEQAARKKEMKQVWFIVYLAVCIFLMIKLAPAVEKFAKDVWNDYPDLSVIPSWVNVEHISEDGISRTGKPMGKATSIVIHSVEPGLSANQVRNLYASDDYELSTHLVVGADGTVLLCIPLNEYSSTHGLGQTNVINIAVCTPAGTSEVTMSTERALADLCAWLVERSTLNVDDVKRHSDVAEVLNAPCPLYYTNNEEAWRYFLTQVSYSQVNAEWKK